MLNSEPLPMLNSGRSQSINRCMGRQSVHGKAKIGQDRLLVVYN
nr:hypothetical protein Q903MT_gene4429 [Picea sitchensis]